LKTMEESGIVRRGMFVAGVGAGQFAMAAAGGLVGGLRGAGGKRGAGGVGGAGPGESVRGRPAVGGGSGGKLVWGGGGGGGRAGRVNGRLAAFLRRKNPAIRVFLPPDEPEREQAARQLAKKLAEAAIRMQGRRSGLLIATINDQPAAEHLLGRWLEESGFV